MEIFLLKSFGCLALLLCFYKIALEKSSLHHLKRVYLLLALIIPFLVPAITFTTYEETNTLAGLSNAGLLIAEGEEVGSTLPWGQILWTVYGIGCSLFAIRFLMRLFKISWRIISNPKQRYYNIIKVLLPQDVVPHTFMSYIFLYTDAEKNNKIPPAVMAHETIHAREMHSIDILLVEVLKVVFWFNPLFYWMTNAIKLNHEFLADRAVLRNGFTPADYQRTILAYSSHAGSPAMAHSINYSSLKKRFTVMKTQTSKRNSRLLTLLMIPLLALLVYSFSTTEVIKVNDTYEVVNAKSFDLVVEQESIILNGNHTKLSAFAASLDAITKDWEEPDYTSAIPTVHMYNVTPSFLKKLNKEFKKTHYSKANQGLVLGEITTSEIIQSVATREEMKEYNKLARRYNNMKKEDRIIKLKDLKRLEYIYSKMSAKQKADAEPFPDCIPPPPPPPPPAPEPGAAPDAGDTKSMGEGTPPPPPPPPPAPDDPLIDLTEVIKEGATFYFNDKQISTSKAKALVELPDKIKRVQVVKGSDGKPKVYFWN